MYVRLGRIYLEPFCWTRRRHLKWINSFLGFWRKYRKGNGIKINFYYLHKLDPKALQTGLKIYTETTPGEVDSESDEWCEKERKSPKPEKTQWKNVTRELFGSNDAVQLTTKSGDFNFDGIVECCLRGFFFLGLISWMNRSAACPILGLFCNGHG